MCYGWVEAVSKHGTKWIVVHVMIRVGFGHGNTHETSIHDGKKGPLFAMYFGYKHQKSMVQSSKLLQQLDEIVRFRCVQQWDGFNFNRFYGFFYSIRWGVCVRWATYFSLCGCLEIDFSRIHCVKNSNPNESINNAMEIFHRKFQHLVDPRVLGQVVLYVRLKFQYPNGWIAMTVPLIAIKTVRCPIAIGKLSIGKQGNGKLSIVSETFVFGLKVNWFRTKE